MIGYFYKDSENKWQLAGSEIQYSSAEEATRITEGLQPNIRVNIRQAEMTTEQAEKIDVHNNNQWPLRIYLFNNGKIRVRTKNLQ